MQFQIREKTGKETPESSRLELKEKFSGNNFASSDAKDNTSGSLNRGGIADLPLLRTLLAIRQKSLLEMNNKKDDLLFWHHKTTSPVPVQGDDSFLL